MVTGSFDRGLAVVVAGLLMTAACGGDFADDTSRGRSEAGIDLFEGGTVADVGAMCPADPPKIGELCDESFETVTCDFLIGECTTSGGATYADFVTYCCFRGVWQTCTGPSICDQMDGGSATGDDARTPGVEDGAPDVGADTPSADKPDSNQIDSAADAAIDDASPGASDAGPDGSAADAGVNDAGP